MKNEKEYIQYLVENFKDNEVLSPILDDYFYDKINFNEVVEKVSNIQEKTILNYHTWLKSNKIDDLLK